MVCCLASGVLGLLFLTPCHGGEPATGAWLHNGVTAHRGNSGEFPENTLPAFASAIEIGCDWLELDVFRTKDGKLVVSHDRNTRRVGDKDLTIADSTYEDLLAVDVATDFRRRHAKSVRDCPPQRIPLLEDVLKLVMTQKRTRVSLQPKMDCVGDAIALVKRVGAEPWVGFNDGNLKYMAEVKRLAPRVPVFWDRHASPIDDDLRVAREHGFEAMVLHESTATAENIGKIRAAGIEAGAWTVDDPAAMGRLLDLGVQRIYTDFPRRLLAVKAGRRFKAVQCEGLYPRHLQGICTDNRDALYWCFTDVLVKTNLEGRVLKQVKVANHHGDLCFLEGKVYVAVNLGKFNQPAGRADSWVYVYDAGDLKELVRHRTPELVHGAGGIAWHDGRFLVVGGLPPGIEENYLYQYDASFHFLHRHVLASGYTLMGIQTAAFADGFWWFGCYGKPPILLKADPDFKLVGKYKFDAGLGIVGLPDGRFLIARGAGKQPPGLTGRLVVAEADKNAGLVVLPRAPQ